MSTPLLVWEYLSVFILAVIAIIDIAGAISRAKAISSTSSPAVKRVKSVLVMVPCKGLDYMLSENLDSLKSQKYGNSRLVAIVDKISDPSLGQIKALGIDFMVSRKVSGKASGKVNAILSAVRAFPNYDAYVIADSDVRFGKGWLEHMILPLNDPGTGLSTMYPYFSPAGGFWSRVKSSWGIVGEGLMKRESTRFGWGGSLAFRKSLLDKGAEELMLNSRYSVSDDICLTIAAKRNGLHIAYIRSPQPAVYSDDGFSTFLEWSNRQTALSIMGNNGNLYIGLPFYIAESLLVLSGISLSLMASPLFIILLLHSARNGLINSKRPGRRLGESVLISFLLPFIYAANLVYASRMKRITWRGTEYRIR